MGVLSLGFVCAADDASLDDMQGNASGEIAIEDSQSDTDKLSTSLDDSDSQGGESETGDKEELFIYIYCRSLIYPWTWMDDDGDTYPGYPGAYIGFEADANTTGNTTIYLDDEVVYSHKGEFSNYLVDEQTFWQHYNVNGWHTVKVVYSGDDRYNPATESADFELDAYYCDIEEDCLVFELSKDITGVLTVKANGRTVFTKDIGVASATLVDHSQIHRFALEGLDSGANYIEVSFTSDSYSFDEYFEYYNPSSNDTAPNPDSNISDGSPSHRQVRPASDSKVSAGDVAAGNPLLLLALALSAAVLLPRRK